MPCFCPEQSKLKYCYCRKLGLKSVKSIPVSDWDTCTFSPFLSSRRHSASTCGIPKIMAVEGGLKERQHRFTEKHGDAQCIDSGSPDLRSKPLPLCRLIIFWTFGPIFIY